MAGEEKSLAALTKEIVASGVQSREDFHEWKRGKSDLLCQFLDYRQQDGMPDVTQIVVPHFHRELGLIGYNYTPAAGVSLHHYQDGWSPTLSLCRGITFDRAGDVVARSFPKFFNFGEYGGDWGEGEPEVTVKEDGHLLIVFRVGDAIVAKTRGEFHSPTAVLGQEVVSAGLAQHWLGMNLKDVTVLCEFIHPQTRVEWGVDYGDRRALILIGLYDHVTGLDLPIGELRQAGDALALETVKEQRMGREALMAVINGGGNNQEGFVARFPNGHRVKFKYGSYTEAMKDHREEQRASKPERLGSRRPAHGVVQRGAAYLRNPVR